MSLHPIADAYERPERIDAIALGNGDHIYAGGTDLIPLTRTGVVPPGRLVDIKRSELQAGVERSEHGWQVGALTTLADLASHRELNETLPIVGDALRQVATPQIRNRATVAGNMLQRPRCSYFRDPDVTCWMKGGDGCPAKTGLNEHHGLGGGDCIATQPSDLASVLVALGANVHIDRESPEGYESTIEVSDLFAAPTTDRPRLHVAERNDVIRGFTIPERPGSRSTYLKAMDRAVWQFALVGVATVVTFDGDVVDRADLVATGIAATPYRIPGTADLAEAQLDGETIRRFADVAVEGLVPLEHNRYKIDLLRGLVIRSLERLA